MTGSWRTGPRIADGVPELSATAACEHVGDKDTLAVSGFGSVGYPKAIPLALAESGRDLALTVVSGGSVGEEIDRVMVQADAIARRFPYQATRAARAAINEGRIAMHDRHIGGLSDEVVFTELPSPDVAVVEAVAVGPDWLVPSTSVGHTPAFVQAANKLVVEVNQSQPRDLGVFHDIYRPATPPAREPIPVTAPDDRIDGPTIGFDPDAFVGAVRTDRPDSTYEFREPTGTDRAIAAHLGAFLTAELDRNPVFAETVRLQFGVGSLGNALMAELGELTFGDRAVSYFGEVIQDGLLDLLADGPIDVASATTLALSGDGQSRLFDDIDTYAEDIILRPADVTNSAELINRMGVFAVNSALEVDIYGHVNSTHVNGSRLINGLGGSNDFNRHAAVSVVALPSTAGDGTISSVVPMVTHVDHTEHDVSVIITEHGVADLRGRAPRERAPIVIDQCAHPDFRPALRKYADRATAAGGHVPHELETVFDWTESGPQ